MRTYTYDHANRLTQAVSGTLTTQYVYNGDGVRTGKVAGGVPTEYLVDLVATLPVVISDTEAVYLYGLDIIAQQQAERYYYVHDGLGSVRQLTTASGDIAETYAYDPFGVPLRGGTAYNPFRFTGEAWDAEVELLYLRARYYQPETGRFLTRDAWEGNLHRPGTLNRYVYVTNDPVDYTDPSGLQVPDPHGTRDGWRDDARRVAQPEIQTACVVPAPTPMPTPAPLSFEQWVQQKWPSPIAPRHPQGTLSIPARLSVLVDAQMMYLRHYLRGSRGYFKEGKTIEWYAISRVDNPVPVGDMGGSWRLTQLTLANGMDWNFHLFILRLRMNESWQSNYEPYFLLLLTEEHPSVLSDTQWEGYQTWCRRGGYHMQEELPLPFDTWVVPEL